ncbi:GNAT superfamily N-acetyltransferase [Rhodopseudomonas julia]|uniref:GNAT superfamily N-acetyltransferase n=1 Tax=Rhodopseudomonas julia TaxID=200617 RepID=A0ABU0C2M5_9BRAD|nr:GNAT family N-acetyltransferase [Rhodopseudomonas julia]MDQ0324765.1 GNAT superfamily N-acetyltransferase [Rhodopseudomonas julia]
MRIRRAEPCDAEAVSDVLIASIIGLCGADHGGIPANIKRWTANKAPGTVEEWIKDPASTLLVAEEDGEIVCVGAFRGAEILLNYVRPAARFSGASKAMLAHMEREMRKQGIVEARLTSTATAHRFYRSAGWTYEGEQAKAIDGPQALPMSKRLS